MQIECVHDESQWQSLRPAWDDLSGGAMMRGYDWTSAWWEAYQDDMQLQILVAKRGDTCCGILPLALTKHAWHGNTLVFLGSGKACSDDTGILCRSADSTEVADAFARYLAISPEACRWDHLNLDGVRDDNPTMQQFLGSMKLRTKSELEIKSSPFCWSTSLEGGWAAFEAKLSKRICKIYRQVCRERDSGNSRFSIAQTPEQAKEYLGYIERLHQARWREKGIDGCFSDKSFSRFLDSVLRNMWKNDWSPISHSTQGDDSEMHQRIQIGMLFIGDQPAAGCIGIGDRDALAYYLTGMDTAFSKVRPGWQLLFAFVQHACSIGCHRIDFLRGDEEYKSQLNASPVAQHRYLMASPRWTSQIRNAAYRAASSVKHWWSPPSNGSIPIISSVQKSDN